MTSARCRARDAQKAEIRTAMADGHTLDPSGALPLTANAAYAERPASLAVNSVLAAARERRELEAGDR